MGMRKNSSDLDGGSQLIVDIIAAVLNDHGVVVFALGDDGDGFTAVAAQCEQECVQIFVVGDNVGDDVFFSCLCLGKIHIATFSHGTAARILHAVSFF